MIPFEYLNNSFSGAISIFTAVFGMAYPLLQECVQRIEDKYICSHIARRFKSEQTYILFNWLIVICMVEAVTFPLLLQLWYFNWWTCAVVCVQLISVFCLMLFTVLFIQMILTYYDVNSLFLRIKKHHAEEELPNLLCLIQYASRKDLGELYRDVLTEIFSFIYEQRRDTPEGQAVTYTLAVTDAINSIFRWSYKDVGSYFYERNDIIGALFDYTQEKMVSEQTYKQVWHTLNNIVQADNEQWFRQYWSLACQYYSFHLSNLRHDHDQSERNRFLEMHLMLGGLLCMHRKYEWLEYMMNYSNSMPPRFDLVPSSATLIFEALYDMEAKADSPFQWQLLAKYNFIGLKGDVYDEHTVVKYVEEYLAMLIVRLWSVNDYNITFMPPMEFPSATEDLDENDRRVKYMERLIRGIRQLYSDYDLEKLKLANLPAKLTTLDFLGDYVKILKQRNEEISGRQEVDGEKIDKIRGEILKALDSKTLRLPQGQHKDGRGTITTPVYAGCNLDPDHMLKGRRISMTGFGDVLVDVLDANTVLLYGRILTSNSHLRHSYSIRYQDIFKAIDKLSINGDFIILLMGTYLEHFDAMYGKPQGYREQGGRKYYNDAEIVFVDSRQSAIVVIRRDELPYYDFVVWNDPARGMEVINDVLHVYSNLDHLKDVSFYLSLCRVFCVEYETTQEFACLKISLNDVNDEMELKDIRPL